MKNAYIFGGSGGQGVVSMGIMLTQCAVSSGKHAVFMPSYGPEQRGGSAKCTVLIDEKEIESPMAQFCSTLVLMSEQACDKFLTELEPGGTLVYDSSIIPAEKVAGIDAKVIPVPAGDIALEIGSVRAANIVVMGALIGATDVVPSEAFAGIIEKKFAKKSEEVRRLNAVAFSRGLELAKSIGNKN